MKKSSILALWFVFYIICAGLGFIPEPEGSTRILLRIIALLFFVPPALLLHEAKVTGDDQLRRLIRNLSAASLGLTLVLIVASILTAMGGETLGRVLHVLLAVCSVPMFCSNYWVLSLFAWAVLLVAAGRKRVAK